MLKAVYYLSDGETYVETLAFTSESAALKWLRENKWRTLYKDGGTFLVNMDQVVCIKLVPLDLPL